MSVIFHVLKEEHKRLIQAERSYKNSIARMPKGSPRIKHIRKRNYLYLAHREGAKVVYDYIGAAESDKAKEIIEQVNKRKRLVSLLKEIRQALKDVKKVLRGKI